MHDGNTHTYTIYSLRGCPYCQSARQLLCRLDLPYTTRYPDRETLRQILGAGPRERITYPQIFIGRRRIGGYDDLTRYLGVARQRGFTVKPACQAHVCL